MASSREQEDLCSLLLMLTSWVNTLVGGQVDKLGKHSGWWPTVGSERIYVLYYQQLEARGFMFKLGKHSGGWPVGGSKRIYVLYY